MCSRICDTDMIMIPFDSFCFFCVSFLCSSFRRTLHFSLLRWSFMRCPLLLAHFSHACGLWFAFACAVAVLCLVLSIYACKGVREGRQQAVRWLTGAHTTLHCQFNMQMYTFIDNSQSMFELFSFLCFALYACLIRVWLISGTIAAPLHMSLSPSPSHCVCV